MVLVVLSIASQDDLKLRLDGYSAKEIRKYKVARILREAYEQGGVLNQADVSQLIGVSAGTIGKDIKEFQLEHSVVLPYRGRCDRYIKGFKKVQKLFNDGIPVENIASELEMSKALVREYVAIVEETTKDGMGEKE